MPCNYAKYPRNWKTEIRPRILARAGNCCEFCKLPNGEIVKRCTDGTWHRMETINAFVSAAVDNDAGTFASHHLDEVGDMFPGYPNELTSVRVVLTIAHLDHDETNHDVTDDRLAALCQRCHLRYDAPEKARRRRLKKYEATLLPITKPTAK